MLFLAFARLFAIELVVLIVAGAIVSISGLDDAKGVEVRVVGLCTSDDVRADGVVPVFVVSGGET